MLERFNINITSSTDKEVPSERGNLTSLLSIGYTLLPNLKCLDFALVTGPYMAVHLPN